MRLTSNSRGSPFSSRGPKIADFFMKTSGRVRKRPVFVRRRWVFRGYAVSGHYNRSSVACYPMDDSDPLIPPKPSPQPSAAVLREVEALRAMLGLPLEEPEPDGRAPLEPPQPDTQIPPFTTPRTNPEGERP